ncbi:inactive selenide, water dikinase-like protein [Drosophila miranda]|uniref:inactive selenide, water dikinase-like protein n=1 Tax=Drosophila miranda TaxID=7229 RepID=UPI0007E5CB40|nr:inactive selenide, water dikinase-like protein [Drosophila miranda]
MCDFNPVLRGLSAYFRLTNYRDRQVAGCKVPEAVVSAMLDSPARNTYSWGGERLPLTQLEQMLSEMNIATSGLLAGVQHHLTVECHYPVIDDPFEMGKIICADSIADFYAMGITECDKMLMLVCRPRQMVTSEFNVVYSLMAEGFKECFRATGGNESWAECMHSDWFIAGGLASSHWERSQLLARDNAVDGDVLVLTKPLGTQVAIDAYGCIGQPQAWEKYKMFLTEEDLRGAYRLAVKSMTRLNRKAASLMHLHNAHGALAVSGRGILAHARTLALLQKQPLSFVIDTLPVIGKLATVPCCQSRLRRGLSHETSGGLLICMPREDAASFCQLLEAQDGHPAWIIGTVQSGIRNATVSKDAQIIEVSE